MNFSRVKQFVLDAKAKNLSIFGHTLAWHSQQQPGYLLGLMSDKEVEDPSGEKVDVVDNYVIYDKLSTDNMWHSNYLDQANNVDYILEIVKK
jgi:GH35 family endo-1,4-beta-xylanase